jgi:hypothetical protein
MPEIAASTPVRPLMMIAAGVGGLMMAVALGLWLHFGTAVFFEMVKAGLALCL